VYSIEGHSFRSLIARESFWACKSHGPGLWHRPLAIFLIESYDWLLPTGA
jgi:hypothetical protein